MSFLSRLKSCCGGSGSCSFSCPSCCHLPEWLRHPEYMARGYSYVYLLLGVYQVLTFWYDVAGFWGTWRYVLIFIGFLIPPVVLGFILLIAVHKRDLQKTWIWWLLEIVQLALFLTLFLVGIHGLSVKTVLVNLLLHGALRALGLKIIYDFMLFISDTCGPSEDETAGSVINRVDVANGSGGKGSAVNSPTATVAGNGQAPFENVPLDDPWSNTSGAQKL